MNDMMERAKHAANETVSADSFVGDGPFQQAWQLARDAALTALQSAGWQPISEAPEGSEEDGPFFDVIWQDRMHRYLPVPARATDCFRRGNNIVRVHGYPAVTTIFGEQPTHFMIVPKL